MAQMDRQLTGSAGEHYVCSMLARMGWAASLTRDGLARTDILAVHSTTRAMIEVQVKTIANAKSWPVGSKGIVSAVSDREWYAFVRFHSLLAMPDCYLVPRDHVAAATWIGHQNWLTHPDAAPGKRNTPVSGARIDASVWRGYQDRWGDLGEPTTSQPVRLPEWMRETMREERVGLCDGHPWHNEDAIPEWLTEPERSA